MTIAISQALVTEFAGGQASDSLLIGIGLVKDSEAVFFEYIGDDQAPRALMLDSGKPLTRMVNVRLESIDVAEEVGQFKATKLNLTLSTTSNVSVMLTSGLNTIWSQCVLGSLLGLYRSMPIDTTFQLDCWKGKNGLKPAFAAIRVMGNKYSDNETYELFADARSEKNDSAKEQIARNVIAQIKEMQGAPIEPVVVTETVTEENEF
jgi:hypothetical protein